ncbi:MAG: hypothetical protein HRU19_19140 [Pseudobacteriovorax sp.]|nr:hypothetical protein [Pseudobacteriovorax sp.]
MKIGLILSQFVVAFSLYYGGVAVANDEAPELEFSETVCDLIYSEAIPGGFSAGECSVITLDNAKFEVEFKSRKTSQQKIIRNHQCRPSPIPFPVPPEQYLPGRPPVFPPNQVCHTITDYITKHDHIDGSISCTEDPETGLWACISEGEIGYVQFGRQERCHETTGMDPRPRRCTMQNLPLFDRVGNLPIASTELPRILEDLALEWAED